MKIVFTIICLLSVTSAFACNAPAGNYQIVSETHAGAKLILNKNNIFTLTFISYEPTNPDISKTTIYKGIWSCQESVLSFKYTNGSASAIYAKPVNYPLGVYKHSMAITFPPDSHISKQLAVGVFWPVL